LSAAEVVGFSVRVAGLCEKPICVSAHLFINFLVHFEVREQRARREGRTGQRPAEEREALSRQRLVSFEAPLPLPQQALARTDIPRKAPSRCGSPPAKSPPQGALLPTGR